MDMEIKNETELRAQEVVKWKGVKGLYSYDKKVYVHKSSSISPVRQQKNVFWLYPPLFISVG